MLLRMRLLCAWHAPFIFTLKRVRFRVARTSIELYPNKGAAVKSIFKSGVGVIILQAARGANGGDRKGPHPASTQPQLLP